ncbi:MAG: hypothetical protein ACRENS_04435 [Candidatus Eiseniibacteriota bacterium]
MHSHLATRIAQAWVELNTSDPEAVSALRVARTHLAAGRQLTGLRRLRLIELEGRLPDAAALEELLHRSTQFYNPHKERCTVRLEASDPAPVPADAAVVLVCERGSERRPAAERWWLHETGEPLEVREGVTWVLSFEPGAPAAVLAAELTTLHDRRHGLLSNPHAQDAAVSGAAVPLPWIRDAAFAAARGGSHARLDAR